MSTALQNPGIDPCDWQEHDVSRREQGQEFTGIHREPFADVQVFRDDPAGNWYIIVFSSDACTYDGCWKQSAGKTLAEAIEHALAETIFYSSTNR